MSVPIEKLTRYPYQDPQTGMERHVADLVAHLRDGTDSRSGFAQKTEAALAHAFWLEKAVVELREEVRALERFMAPTLPSVKMYSSQIDTRDPAEMYPCAGGAVVFDWEMEKIAYRCMWRDGDPGQDQMMARIKRRSYRDIITRFRKEFERTWTFNLSRRRAP